MYTDRKNTRWFPKGLVGFFVLATGPLVAVSAFAPSRPDAVGRGMGAASVLAADGVVEDGRPLFTASANHLAVGGTGNEAEVALGATSEAGLQCLICIELRGPDGEGDLHWFHGFLLDTEEICEENPGVEMCRACGGESQCHDLEDFDLSDPEDVFFGRCHQPCAPAYVLLDLSSEVSQLASSLDTRSMTTLAQMINNEPHLEFDPTRNAVQLLECGGGVRQEWIVDRIAGSRLLLPAAIQ